MNRVILAILITLAVFMSVHAKEGEEKLPKASEIRKLISPYTKALVRDAEKLEKQKDLINLGRTLFYDKRLSESQKLSCNSCHDLAKYGTNGEHYEKLKADKKVYRDVPSLYNKSGLILFSWDGAHKTIKGQIAASIVSPNEMGIKDKSELLKRLNAVKGYKALVKKAISDADILTFDILVNALEAFQLGLVTPAPIDKFIDGDDKALGAEALKGAVLFDQHNCAACHTGTAFGGQMLQKIGAVQEWPNQTDSGYFHISKNPKHKMIFRVASLRNVEKTAPYFHDASSRRLWDAVKKMAWYELGQHISVADVLGIQAFLKTLTGEIPKDYIKAPVMPK